MLTNYCRICLTSIGVVHQLDEVVHKSLTLYAILCKMYPEAFADNNETQWPTKACEICKQAILDAYGLYVVCMSTLGILKKRLKNNPHESNQAKAEVCFSDQSLIVADNNAVYFTGRDRNKSDEEENKSFLTIEEEESQPTVERIEEEGQNNALILFREQQENDILLQPQTGETTENRNVASAYYSHEIVELSVEMDFVAPNNTIPIEEEHLDDFEGSMEYLDDEEDSLHTTPHQENDYSQGENAFGKNTAIVLEYSDAIINPECLEDGSDESEEDVFANIFSTDILCCECCRDVFLDKASYEKHLKHHRLGRLICKMCNKGFKTATALNAHECKYESSTLCWICGNTTDTPKKHKRHMQSHMPEGTWACQLCPLRFNSKTVLKGHIRTHKKDRGYCCDVCGANLSSKRNLKYHQRSVHGGGVEKVFSCTICDRRFSLPYALKTHMKTHTGLRPYSCVYCNRVYGCGGDLVEHVAKHHIGNDNIYQCHQCDEAFPRIKQLRDHYEVHFRNGEQFYNEILTEFGKFRFTTMDLLNMRHRKETKEKMIEKSNRNGNNSPVPHTLF
ncbi:zinc finger protein 572-like isoform X2 [Anopheles albimanus]|uniref:zinc finger protein 572-like isoform X2 n=1 Tax=Anopheles albimanus TaxID=7167 RepID=UPI00163E38C6|nr:zinc finger protein 572-like isoform X2 [Anopheles albimanus]